MGGSFISNLDAKTSLGPDHFTARARNAFRARFALAQK